MAEVTHTITTNKSPAEVYKLVSTPQEMTRWFCNAAEPTAKGFKVSWNLPDGGSVGFEAEMMEDIANQSFVYRTIEDIALVNAISIKPIPEGSQVTVVETGFPDTDEGKALMEEHQQGLEFFLRRLQEL
jgi:uncharacterized protein YndB with AHSA1/START domain